MKKRFVRFNTDFFHKMLKDFNVFGYGTTFIDCTDIVGLAGKNVPELTKGMAIELKSDFSRPPPSGFRYGERVHNNWV